MPISIPLPSGTVTFLFTDIEGSTRLWENYPELMQVAVARHDALVHQAVELHHGIVFKTTGDGIAAVFATASDALYAALAAQQALLTEPWSELVPLRARMGLHTGVAEQRNNDYFGPVLNRTARLMSVGHGGQTLLSATTQELCRDTLPPLVRLHSLGEHRLKDLIRPETIFLLAHPTLPDPTSFPPLKSLDNPAMPHNLPRQITSFIGREKQLAEVTDLLSHAPLLTLTGSGGTGKTRLALQVAADMLDPARFPDGAWIVELAPLSDPALVPQAVAQVVGVQERMGQLLTQTLSDFLKSKRLLMLLDNCEHLIQSCATFVSELLRSCPGVTILATSREPLNIRGEQIYRVPSLSLPDPKSIQTLTLDSLSPFEAVRLFIDRAILAQPDFAVTNANAPALAQLCYRLDGIPLAVELAAARVRSLSIEDINARLGSRFRLLTSGDRSALPRQQTLRALIDWSYDLLSEQEKILLGRLSVFAGGWTLAAAEAVCGFAPIEDWEVLDLLTALSDKSLVQAESGSSGSLRYGMLETVRQYGAEKLSQIPGATDHLCLRHGTWCLALVEEAEPHLMGVEQTVWLERLEAEHDNMRTALSSLAVPPLLNANITDSESESPALLGLRLAGALHRFWRIRGYLSEGRENLERALQVHQIMQQPATETATPSLLESWQIREKGARANALLALGSLALHQSDYTIARERLEQALALFHKIGDKSGIANTLVNQGIITFEQGDYGLAQAHYEQALPLYREVGNTRGIAVTLSNLGVVASNQGEYEVAREHYEQALTLQRAIGNKLDIAHLLENLGIITLEKGDYGLAREYNEQALALYREVGNKSGIGSVLTNLGNIAFDQSDYQIAQELHTQALTLYREIGSKSSIATTRTNLGSVALRSGNYARAQEHYEQAMSLSRASGNRRLIAYNLEGLAEIARSEGMACDSERALEYLRPAVVLFAVADALRESIGSPLSPVGQAQQAEQLAQVRAILGEEVFTSAWAEGMSLPWEQVVEETLQGVSSTE